MVVVVGRRLTPAPSQTLSNPETVQTTNDVKEQLQNDLITLCFSYNPQIPEELISELCQVVVEWDQELID